MQLGSALPPFMPVSPGEPAHSRPKAPAEPAPSSAPAQEPSSYSPGNFPVPSVSAGSAPSDSWAQQQQQLEIAALVKRDREVRAHEQAHAAVGGAYTGAPRYNFTRGPDGQRYAVGGEVSIDTAAVPGDPEATLRKMETVLRAALAPAEPSAQDLRMAVRAQAQATQARAELAEQRREQSEVDQKKAAGEQPSEKKRDDTVEAPAAALDLYRRLEQLPTEQQDVDLFA
ncbi:putative metalloprotease CJM1_0395 family protein [Pseudomonas sp. NCCP-436]|uniref:putative metalloprotease CJM1_0395 family protein n=1 Tax=Pseudomonas sp. NCCP-436 TaxID=2842481 RepID=UPI001C7F773A|nr:putative metalloprotease CJM1_0395 family protein [Pseudomonas sp. NCCP-436]GIZ12656.1 hypothetical protein NCCP436_20720 [Pseudomonas sp. NCCP-436]